MSLTSNQRQNHPPMLGSMVALVTPMLANGSVDWSRLKQLVEWHIVCGTHGIVAVGTTGESATLNVDEHARVIEEVIAVNDGRIFIIAGTGANSTSEAIDLTQTAKRLGADASLLVTPYYNKPTQEGLFQHYQAIAAAVDLPHILYNVPGRTGVDMLNDTVLRLADVDNICAIKDATGDLTRGKDLIDRLNGRLDVYSGDDATAKELILLGARGNISVTANIAPELMSAMCQAALDGHTEQAATLHAQLTPLNDVMFCESNPIPVKYALAKMGKIENTFRLPLTPLGSSFHDRVDRALIQANLITLSN